MNLVAPSQKLGFSFTPSLYTVIGLPYDHRYKVSFHKNVRTDGLGYVQLLPVVLFS